MQSRLAQNRNKGVEVGRVIEHMFAILRLLFKDLHERSRLGTVHKALEHLLAYLCAFGWPMRKLKPNKK